MNPNIELGRKNQLIKHTKEGQGHYEDTVATSCFFPGISLCLILFIFICAFYFEIMQPKVLVLGVVCVLIELA